MSLPDDAPRGPRTRNVWLWTAIGTTVAVLLLWAGTQLAKATGQSVEWYTGFGQWLGALGSLVAAVVALWIATTDRQRAHRAREAERDEAAADLARRAGLVLIEAHEMSAAVQIYHDTDQGISVRNHRDSRIYDIQIVRYVRDSVPGTDIELKLQMRLFPPSERWSSPLIDLLPVLYVEPGQVLAVYPKGWADEPEFVAVRYTDQSGLRWEVTTEGGPARKVA